MVNSVKWQREKGLGRQAHTVRKMERPAVPEKGARPIIKVVTLGRDRGGVVQNFPVGLAVFEHKKESASHHNVPLKPKVLWNCPAYYDSGLVNDLPIGNVLVLVQLWPVRQDRGHGGSGEEEDLRLHPGNTDQGAGGFGEDSIAVD